MKNHVIRACRHFLAPIVRLLLRHGVTWREFAELTKEVYVDVARRDYGLQGRPTNVARVAMLTGLSRREVMRVRDVLGGELQARAAPQDRISQVLSGWHVDPEFLTPNGEAAELPVDGDRASLSALLKRYAGDLPHGAVLKELLRLNVVEESAAGYRVVARSVIRSATDPQIIRQAGIALHDHAVTLNHNTDASRDSDPWFEGMATTYRLAPKNLAALNEFLNIRGQSFLEEADAWLSLHEEPDNNQNSQQKVARAGVGIYLIRDETQGSKNK